MAVDWFLREDQAHATLFGPFNRCLPCWVPAPMPVIESTEEVQKDSEPPEVENERENENIKLHE